MSSYKIDDLEARVRSLELNRPYTPYDHYLIKSIQDAIGILQKKVGILEDAAAPKCDKCGHKL